MAGRSGAYEAAATLEEAPDELLGVLLAGLALGSDLEPSDLEPSDLAPSDLLAPAPSAALGSLALWEPLLVSERLSVL